MNTPSMHTNSTALQTLDPTSGTFEAAHDSARVLSNTHALLSITLLWSAATATASVVYGPA